MIDCWGCHTVIKGCMADRVMGRMHTRIKPAEKLRCNVVHA